MYAHTHTHLKAQSLSQLVSPIRYTHVSRGDVGPTVLALHVWHSEAQTFTDERMSPSSSVGPIGSCLCVDVALILFHAPQLRG